MDSRDIPPPPSHQQLQPPPGMVMSHYRNPNAAGIMGPTSTSQSIHHRLPFGALAPQQQQPPQTLHQQQQQQQQIDQKTLESLGFGDGSTASPQSMRFGMEQQNQNQQVKKKRGRPRKYTPDGNIALGLAPTSPLLSAASNSYGAGDGGGVGDSGGGGGTNGSADPPAKRNRGRPPGCSKKQLDALGTAGIGFTPHVIEVKTGEDIASKVMAFSEQGPRTICILSASGAVSTVTLRQASNSGGTVTYEGRFEIITLSGSFLNYEVNGGTNRSGTLSVALAGPDGRILGGCVFGSLVAATQVQVIVGSFVAEAKKPKQNNNGRGQNPEPGSAPAAANMLNFGSNSQGPSSESSEENESGSSPSMHRDNNNNNNNGIFGNSVVAQQQQQQLHEMQKMQQMYQLWPRQ